MSGNTFNNTEILVGFVGWQKKHMTWGKITRNYKFKDLIVKFEDF